VTAGRGAALAVGVVFGLTLCWSGMSDPEVIRGALLLEQSYLFLFFASAVLTAAVGQALLRRVRARALLADEEIVVSRQQPERRHVVGGFVFGLGWGVANVCPGPIATQLGEGIPWALFTMTGVVVGILIFFRRGEKETEPASDGHEKQSARPQPRPRIREEPSGVG